jgi:hypothetical protein
LFFPFMCSDKIFIFINSSTRATCLAPLIILY